MKTSSRFPLLLVAAVLLAGCAGDHVPRPSPLCTLRDADGTGIPAQFTGTTARTHRTRAANHVVQLATIETGRCPEFDRVVFDFDGLRLPPDYTIEYVRGPVSECGSGAHVPLAGSAILRIVFKTTQAHTDDGQATATPRNRRVYLPNLRQLVMTCDFEGQVEVVLGLEAMKPYRVVELLNDSKLVLDVKR